MVRAEARRKPPIELHLRGRLDTAAFLGLAHLLAARQASRRASRILLDWSELVSWHFTRPSIADVQHWLAFTKNVDRVAIVHQRRWNRQAACIAAVLRTKDCQVRSFRFDGRDRAIAWLTERRALGSRPAKPGGCEAPQVFGHLAEIE